MNTHRARIIDDPPQRTYTEGEMIPIQCGCYVDGCQYTVRGANVAALNVAYGMGAITPEEYSRRAAPRTSGDGRGLDWMEEGEEIVALLNGANVDSVCTWAWEEGDLFYG